MKKNKHAVWYAR